MGVTLDAGALIAFERGDPRLRALVQEARATTASLAVPAAVLAQVWRDGARQARLAALVKSRTVEIVVLDAAAAKASGRLCGLAGTADVVDASVALVARVRGDRVVTTDPEDIAALDPGLELVAL